MPPDEDSAIMLSPLIVLDTNILVAAAYAPDSASARIVGACRDGRLQPVVSAPLQGEYETICRQAIRGGRDFDLSEFLACCKFVEPDAIPRVVPDDPEDDKLIAAAVAAEAEAIITNDDHLLSLESHSGVEMLRPGEFVRRM